jgi:hypothetical protein
MKLQKIFGLKENINQKKSYILGFKIMMMKLLSRTDLIKSNRDLKMELDIAYDKVRIGLNEKSIDMMNIDYNSIYDYSCVKSCNGNFKGRVVSNDPTKNLEKCQKCYRDSKHIHCSKCDRTKNRSSIKLLSENEIHSLKENLIENFDNNKKICAEFDLEQIQLAREILSRLYRMNVDKIQDPYSKIIAPIVVKFASNRIYNKIQSIDYSIFSIPTVNLIADESEIIKDEFSSRTVRTQRLKSIDEISIQDHTPLIENFENIFSKKQIQKLVSITFKNSGILLDDSISKIKISENQIENSLKRDERLKEKNLIADQQAELKKFKDNILNEKMEKLISNDSLLMKDSELSKSIIEFFQQTKFIESSALKEANAELKEIKYLRSLDEAELRHWINQPDHEFGSKRIPILKENIMLIDETIQVIIAGII